MSVFTEDKPQAPPRVGDWWLCQECGDAKEYPASFRWGVAVVVMCDNMNVRHGVRHRKPLTLTEADWLKCRNPHALLAMNDTFRQPPDIPLSPAPSTITEAWVRCTLGNPFRPFVPDPSWLKWRDGTVTRLAEGASKKTSVCQRCKDHAARDGWRPGERADWPSAAVGYVACPFCRGWGVATAPQIDCERLSILADALEEAGCTIDHVLRHLREPWPHWPGCFVLRAILEA